MPTITAPALLAGIALAALLFAAFLYSFYRIFMTTALWRFNYVVLTLSTLMVVVSITWDLAGMTLMAGVTCAVSSIFALFAERRWSKLLPLVQLAAGGLCIWAGATVLA